MRFIVAMLMAMLFSTGGIAQDTPVTPPVKEMKKPKRNGFQLALVKAVKESRKKGEMSNRQALRLRVAMLSPAFRKQAEDLAVTQMAFSGTDDPLPRGEDGKINRAGIDWDNLLVFLEKLLPFILQLLDMFASNSAAIAFQTAGVMV